MAPIGGVAIRGVAQDRPFDHSFVGWVIGECRIAGCRGRRPTVAQTTF